MPPRRRVTSAGLLLHRGSGATLEVLVAHMGGPLWARKDARAWSLPKGEYTDDEDAYAAARREFAEELGSEAPDGPPLPLGEVRQSGGKVVTAWALAGDLDVATVRSNDFELEWPPRSGRVQRFPEIDRAAWFAPDVAREKLVAAQSVFVDRLFAALDDGTQVRYVTHTGRFAGGPMTAEHTDVLIIGAGISGIGTACHLARDCPDKSVRILERRSTIGGTWDLFRYPGVRSDSDMFTFGYNFRPWSDTKVLADGESIRHYLHDTAVEYQVEKLIDFDRHVVSASWSSAQNRWTVETRNGAGEPVGTYTADVLVAGTGYYNYDTGYRPEFPGQQDFAGTVVHPQHWPADLDYAGKKVVIIGSGATAVTLVPALAERAAHVTMLQRSPTYILSLPARDAISARLRKVLPDNVVWKLARARNIGVQRATYALARVRPNTIRNFVVKGAEKALAGTSDIANFTPRYDPWDQRLCVVPDGDLFRAVRNGRADVVTDRIKTFTADGIELESGDRLEADIIVSATGLDVQILGGAVLDVDGEPVAMNERLTYKATLVEGVPNFAFVFGYINASWTLKADLAAEYLCRVLTHLDNNGLTTFVAHGSAEDHGEGSVLGALNSGYVRRGDPHLPRQGSRGPWRVTNDFLRDAATLRHGSIDDGVLELSAHAPARTEPRAGATAT